MHVHLGCEGLGEGDRRLCCKRFAQLPAQLHGRRINVVLRHDTGRGSPRLHLHGKGFQRDLFAYAVAALLQQGQGGAGCVGLRGEESPEGELVAINPNLVIGPSLRILGGAVDMSIVAMESSTVKRRYICAVSEKPLHLRGVSEILRSKSITCR